MHIITATNRIGTLGRDEQGQVWVSFHLVNETIACAECGAVIRHGWVRGRIGEVRVHFCGEHVSVKQEGE